MKQVSSAHGTKDRTPVKRGRDRELVVTRAFNVAPGTVSARGVSLNSSSAGEVSKSASGVLTVSCDMDIRTGGKCRLEFGAGGSETIASHGKYIAVAPNERIVWTNDEGRGHDRDFPGSGWEDVADLP